MNARGHCLTARTQQPCSFVLRDAVRSSGGLPDPRRLRPNHGLVRSGIGRSFDRQNGSSYSRSTYAVEDSVETSTASVARFGQESVEIRSKPTALRPNHTRVADVRVHHAALDLSRVPESPIAP